MAQFFKPKGRKKSTSNYVLTGTADALDHQGRGVVRLSKQGKNRVYFVPQVLPGETAQFKVTGQQNTELLARQNASENHAKLRKKHRKTMRKHRKNM